MARPWRIQYSDAVYHIAVRGNNRQRIFIDDDDRALLLDLFGRSVHRFHLRILAFCLMSNHYHLFLQTEEANLSRAMQWLNGTYTSHYNRRHKHLGHLFQGRYKSTLVLEEGHYLHLSMYIHLNPVRAGMVEDPGRYQWSSFVDYTHLKSRFPWLEREDILSHYGSRFSRYRRYRQECLALARTRPDFIERLKSGVIIGSREKLEGLLQKYRPRGRVDDVTDYSKAQKKHFSPQRELEKLAALLGVSCEDLLKPNKRLAGRTAAYYHLVENCGMGVSETAKTLEVSRMAVSLGIKRFKMELASDRKLQSKLKPLMFNV